MSPSSHKKVFELAQQKAKEMEKFAKKGGREGGKWVPGGWPAAKFA